MPRESTGNDKLLQVKITPKDFEALERLARIHNTTVSDIVRRQVRQTIQAASTLLEPVA